ncbi:MAG: hypothetical protein QOE35_1783 [Actinomycetota bacterium]
MTVPLRALWLLKGLGRGGAEQLAVDSIRHIDPAVVAVEVAYVLPWKDALVPALVERKVPVHCLGGGGPADLRWVWRLRKLIRTGNYDIVHTHMPVPAVAARLVAPRRVRLVHTEHNLWERYRPLTAKANALTYARNTRAFAVSSAVAASITPRRPGRPPVEVLVHGIDVDAITGAGDRAGARAVLGIAEGVPVVGTVGNFTPKKDHATLITAFAQLRRDHPEAELALVGTGPEEHAVRRQVTAAGLEGRVHFLGLRDDVPDLLAGFDVFVLSSRFEGLPIALLEAMASGLACVATAVGGVPEVVTHGEDGLLVPPGDAAGLAVALGKVLEDAALRNALGSAAATTGAGYDIAPAVARTLEVYAEVTR